MLSENKIRKYIGLLWTVVAIALFAICPASSYCTTSHSSLQISDTLRNDDVLRTTKNCHKHHSQHNKKKHHISVPLRRSYDSTLTSLQDLRAVVQRELKETNNHLVAIDNKLDTKSFLQRIKDEAPTKIFWDFVLKPFVGWLLGLLGSISLIAKILTLLGIKKAHGDVRSSTTIVAIDKVASIALYFTMLLLIIYSLLLGFAPRETAGSVGTNGTEVIERLSRIETLLSTSERNATPPVSNSSIVFLSLAFLLVIALVVFVVTLPVRRIMYWPVSLITGGIDTNIKDGAQILSPLVLGLIVYLLPHPAGAFILPFIVSDIIGAIFKLIYLHPTPTLLRIVTRSYSPIIYAAYYGVWSGFFYAIKALLDPVWMALVTSIFLDYHMNMNIIEYFWQWTPFLMALLAAIPGWRQLRKVVETQQIPSLKVVLEQQEKTSKEPE